jgi:flagellar motor switch/type III secretory pathway protein FliN
VFQFWTYKNIKARKEQQQQKGKKNKKQKKKKKERKKILLLQILLKSPFSIQLIIGKQELELENLLS